MGGRGAMMDRGFVSYEYRSVGTIEGVKVLEYATKGKAPNLPFASNTPGTSYILKNGGDFKMLRMYNDNRFPAMEIEYGTHRGRKSLHVHYWEGGNRKTRDFTGEDKKKYGKILKAAGYKF